jgi:tetratricopeptide (TPR) repeat protein
MAEDHQLASTFLVEVHDAIAHLPGATPAREKLLVKSLDYLNGLSRDAGDDPELHRAVATAYEKFAELQGGMTGTGLGKSYDALESAQRAREIRETLAQRSRDAKVQLELANNYLLTTFLIGRTASPDERLEYDRKALAIAETLYATDNRKPEYIDLLARSHTSLAYGLTVYERWEESRKHFQRALTLRTNSIATSQDPLRARREMARIHYRLGAGYAQAGQSAEAVGYLRQALAIQGPMSEANPNDESLASDTGASYHFLGVALRGSGDTRGSIEMFNKVIALREAALARDPHNARSRSLLAGNYAERGTSHAAEGRVTDAFRDLRRALELQTVIAEGDPKGTATRFAMADIQSRLASLYAKMAREGRSGSRDQHWRDAAKYFRRADALYTALAGEGMLQSAPLQADAKRTAEGAREAAAHLAKD